MSKITNKKQSDYLGTGWAFPLQINVQGIFTLSSARHNIKESIAIILGTKLGERVYRPNFGSRLSELAFAPMNRQTLLLIRLYVQEALEMWEPRIVLDRVYTEANPSENRVNIIIEYHPKDTYDSRSLVYPFYLKPST
ncbi:MAG: GPW/gp25 family protein [Prochloraceae cyanobacterium]